MPLGVQIKEETGMEEEPRDMDFLIQNENYLRIERFRIHQHE
jgi:hypothetical protein